MNSANTGLTIQNSLSPLDTFSDARIQGYQGPSRYVRLGRVTPNGTAAIAKSEDGFRCAVAGKETLRIVRVSPPGQTNNSDRKSAVGAGGHRIDASRNFWDNSGLKIDSTSTDVAWGYGMFNNKILTSARNGELILWDLNRNGARYERRSKDHIRAINKLSVSHVAHYYCITGSADGDMRIWDLRDLTKSLMRVRHPTSIRSLVFSPSVWQPLQAIVGLDNGSIHRWDLKMGQRGGLDRLAVAHSAPITSLDWCSSTASSNGNAGPGNQQDPSGSGLGWLVSGGLDRCVKVWDLTAPSASSRIPNKPTYILHPSFPVRRVAWRPGYECELAVVSNDEVSVPVYDASLTGSVSSNQGLLSRVGSGLGLDAVLKGFNGDNFPVLGKDPFPEPVNEPLRSPSGNGDVLEIWDVRREWIAKWSVSRAAADGSMADIAFSDSHALWAQYSSGTFSQLDLREATKPIAAINRVASSWDVAGSLTFVTNKPSRWDPPYDDIQPPERNSDVPKATVKCLGDPPTKLKSQAFSTFITKDAIEDLEMFTYLARNYRFQGSDKKELCEINAEVSKQAGFLRGSQTWKLMNVTFSDYLPPTPQPTAQSSPRKPSVPSGLHPSAPTNFSFPPSGVSNDLSSKWSPGRRNLPLSHPSQLRSRSPSTARRLTPTSSTNSSPRHLPVGLPVTPNRTNMFARRASVDSGGPGSRQTSAFRRPALGPFTPSNGVSPSDRALPSLRHVGEGALDDSSSSSDGQGGHSDEEEISHPPISPASLGGKQLTAPSPLSKIAVQQHWSEDEGDVEKDDNIDDDSATSSPSPRSTDTESDGSSLSRREAKSRSTRRASVRLKSRSRSSTIASLAAPPLGIPRLVHQDSHSSIRTVTATEAKETEEAKRQDENSTPLILSSINNNTHRQQKSQTISEFVQESETEEDMEIVNPPDKVDLSQRRIELIRTEEKRFREMAWSAVRDALDGYIEEGDIQISAMICLIAQDELKIPVIKVIRILEAYLDRLMRLRLYTCAAFIRKHSKLEELRNPSLVETVIYTTCARCHKPTMRPAIPPQSSSKPSTGAFAYCLGCHATTVSCTICRLPVRALLFQCSICHHGGHQSCYRRYYMENAMLELPTSALPISFSSQSELEDNSSNRGRPLSRNLQPFPPSSSAPSAAAFSTTNTNTISTSSSSSSSSATIVPDDSDASSVITDFSTHSHTSVLPTNPSPTGTERQSVAQKFMGHPCATGCGHFCWAANMVLDDP